MLGRLRGAVRGLGGAGAGGAALLSDGRPEPCADVDGWKTSKSNVGLRTIVGWGNTITQMGLQPKMLEYIDVLFNQIYTRKCNLKS